MLSFAAGLKAQLPHDADAVRDNVLDTLLIDRDLRNWSLRLFGNGKTQIFRMSNENIKLTYIPNNNFGTGIGLATRKLILDLAINIRDPRTDNTKRFDLQGGYITKNHVFDAYIQVYEGFNVGNSLNSNDEFRDDINSTAIGLDYIYLFNKDEFNQGMLRSGLKNQKRNVTSFGAGAFILFNQVSADRSIVPEEFEDEFNAQGQLTRFTDYGGGVMLGFFGLFKLPSNFFAAFGAKAGAGLVAKKGVTDELTYNPRIPGIYTFSASGLIGYRRQRFYTNFSFGGGIYLTGLGFSNDVFFTHAQGKLVFGYRLFGRKKK